MSCWGKKPRSTRPFSNKHNILKLINQNRSRGVVNSFTVYKKKKNSV